MKPRLTRLQRLGVWICWLVDRQNWKQQLVLHNHICSSPTVLHRLRVLNTEYWALIRPRVHQASHSTHLRWRRKYLTAGYRNPDERTELTGGPRGKRPTQWWLKINYKVEPKPCAVLHTTPCHIVSYDRSWRTSSRDSGQDRMEWQIKLQPSITTPSNAFDTERQNFVGIQKRDASTRRTWHGEMWLLSICTIQSRTQHFETTTCDLRKHCQLWG